MKKILLSIFALGTLAMNAQDVTGFSKGNIALTTGFGFGTSSTAVSKTTTINFDPSMMYMTTANWGIRGGINFMNVNTENKISNVSVSNSQFGFSGGARYFFTPTNRLSFFMDGGANTSFPTNLTQIGFNLSPGVNYFIHKNWAMGAMFNLANLNISAPTGGDATVNFAIDPVTNLGGLNFTLMYVIK